MNVNGRLTKGRARQAKSIQKNQAAKLKVGYGQAETASYLAAMCGELTLLAYAINLPLVSHFLNMAKAEAEFFIECAPDKTRIDDSE